MIHPSVRPSMDTTISPNLLLLNSLSLSSSSSPSKPNLLLKQQPPDFLNSINELSDVSTALSAFLHDFHDLRDHITSISSAIDAQLPPHLLLQNTTTTTTEAIVAEQNPNGTEKGNGQLAHANNDDAAASADNLRKVVEETSDQLQGIDVLMKEKESDILVSEEDIDIWKMIEDIDCHDDDALSKKTKKRKEAGIIDKINMLLKEPGKSDSFSKAGEIDKLKEEDRETDIAEKKHEENDVSKEDGEIEILEDGEIDMLENGEIDILKEKDREIDVLKKESDILVSEEDIDIWKMIEDIDCHDDNALSKKMKKRKETEIVNKINKDPEKSDSFRKPAEIDKLKQDEGTDISKEEDRETLVAQKKKKKHKKTDVSKEDEEIDMSNESDEITKPKKKPREETDASKKLVENDAEEMDVPKEPQGETNASKKPVEVDILNKPDVSKKPQEETDASKIPVEIDVLNQPEEVYVSNKPEKIDVPKNPDEIDVSNKPEEIDVSNKADEIDASKKKSAIAMLQFFCKRMQGKKIKKHVAEHIYEMKSLHREIAKSLKIVTSPAKLVLNVIGRFFLQTRKAYYSGEFGHQQIALRQASVLILECFVMISGDGIKISEKDKEYAENAAIDWRKRMIKEGGLMYMEAVDARGLLLFISGFGIPDGVFSNEDLIDLIRASNVKEISNALRHSTILIPKLPEVIDWMVKNNLEIEAADIAYTFGLEDKCHPETILMTFLHHKINHTQNGSSLQVNAATMQQLSDLKSIRRCLESHKIDPSKFLPGVKMNEKIEQLEKVINELDLKSNEEKSTLNRKEKETEFSKLNKPEVIDVSKKADEIDASKKSAIAVLECLCKYQSARKVRIHVVQHISELNSLHQEIAMALKLARSPAMLVLDCLCRFYLPTSRGEFRHQQFAEKCSKAKEQNIAARQASVLILECFVMISGDGIKISKKDREYAENAAIDWRKRMIEEGGLIYMEAVDARGLLLFISGFGIPHSVFSNEDFSDLIRASNVKEISNALRHSTIFISKLPEIIDWMVKNNLEIEAADIAYTFGLEDKCHPETILMTFLHSKIKDTENGSSLQVDAATMQQLSDLKSIRRCLETHKIDPSKFLPGVKMNEQIEQLEKVINELDLKSNEEKSTLKRKENETKSSKMNKPEEIRVSKKPDEIDVSIKPKKVDVSNKLEDIDVSKKDDEIDVSKKPTIAELEFWCERMCAKKIKQHVVAHISEMKSLHHEVIKALKLARNPAKLVLDSIADFSYRPVEHTTMGNLGTDRLLRKFKKKNKKQIALRQASVLILECFVMMSGDGIEITKKDAEYAENAAIDWRKRMIKEGGLIYMEAVDARGLLLFISGFGIPDGVFSNEDFSDLIRASNVKEISNALRYSTILIPKLPEVIDWMVKNNLEIEAADIAYTFGLEDKCHPETILMTFLHNKIKDTQNGSSLQVNAAMTQQLSDLKSIRRCLETHKIDPSKFLPGVKINETIEQLEKAVNERDLKSNEEKSTLKRKEKETEFSEGLNHPQQAKRICDSHENFNPHDHYGIPPYNLSTQPSRNSYFDRNLANNNYVTTYSASSVFSAPVPPPNITSSGLAASYGPCVYGGPVAEPMPNTNNPWPYWGQPYSRQSQVYHPYPSFPGMPGGFFIGGVPSSDLYRFADTVVERGSHRGPRAAGSNTRR